MRVLEQQKVVQKSIEMPLKNQQNLDSGEKDAVEPIDPFKKFNSDTLYREELKHALMDVESSEETNFDSIQVKIQRNFYEFMEGNTHHQHAKNPFYEKISDTGYSRINKKLKILNFSLKNSKIPSKFVSSVSLQNLRKIVKNDSKFSAYPLQVLEAPGLDTNQYLNLLDWSSENNLAIGLESGIYCWK